MSVPRLLYEDRPAAITRTDDPSRWFSRQFVLFLQHTVREHPQYFPRWSEDENDTEILITDEVPIQLDSDGRRVSLQLMTGMIQNMNLSINHLVSRNFLTGESTHMDLWSGQAAINVHAFNDDEARAIAHRIAYVLQRHRWKLIRMADLHFVGHSQSFGPTSPPPSLARVGEASPQSVMCSVSFPFFYQESWVRRPKEVPHGQHNEDTGGHGVADGVDLEDPPTLQQYLLGLQMRPLGTFDGHAEDLRETLRVGRNVVTSTGRMYRTVQIMGETAESLNKRDPIVKNHEIIKK